MRQWRINAVGQGALGGIRLAGSDYEFRTGQNDDDWRPVAGGFSAALAAVIAATPDGVLLDDLAESDIVLKIPRHLRKGQLRHHQARSVKQGIETLDYVVQDLAGLDWNGLRLLDYGCGTKFAQSLSQYPRPFGRYTGVDIDAEMVGVLQDRVSDKRFEFAHVDFGNRMYNELQSRMGPDSRLPIPEEGSVDLVTMQSVLTHFDPDDFENCLAMLRKYLDENGLIFFTLISSPLQEEPFRDIDPSRPLLRASYSEDYAISLIESAGYDVVDFRRRRTHRYLPEHVIVKPK